MSDKVRCTCRRCAIRSLMGPAVITTVGILFLLSEFAHSYFFSFWRTFPVILIVIGAILLASSMAPTEGHISDTAAPVSPPPPPASGQGQ
jgi:hypothetical protein